MISYSTTREHPSVAVTHESPADLHSQTRANTSDQPSVLTLALSHSLHYV
jgi:hypothetical protein